MAEADNVSPSAPITAVLCDLDGTLVDSAEGIRAALNESIAHEKLRHLTLDEVKSIIGDGSEVTIARAVVMAGGTTDMFERTLLRYVANYAAIAIHRAEA